MADKDGNKTGGRSKGTPNKINKELKEMILGALDDAGGQKYLAIQAIENPAAFMALVGKVLPRNINSTVSITNELTALTEPELQQRIMAINERINSIDSRPHSLQ